jgi:hypothetical protein
MLLPGFTIRATAPCTLVWMPNPPQPLDAFSVMESTTIWTAAEATFASSSRFRKSL